jgi:hypothetical protein
MYRLGIADRVQVDFISHPLNPIRFSAGQPPERGDVIVYPKARESLAQATRSCWQVTPITRRS